jgi:hypothetical protein
MFLQVIENLKLFPDEAEVFVEAKALRSNGVAVAPEFNESSLIPTTVGFLRELAAKEAASGDQAESSGK